MKTLSVICVCREKTLKVATQGMKMCRWNGMRALSDRKARWLLYLLRYFSPHSFPWKRMICWNHISSVFFFSLLWQHTFSCRLLRGHLFIYLFFLPGDVQHLWSCCERAIHAGHELSHLKCVLNTKPPRRVASPHETQLGFADVSRRCALKHKHFCVVPIVRLTSVAVGGKGGGTIPRLKGDVLL